MSNIKHIRIIILYTLANNKSTYYKYNIVKQLFSNIVFRNDDADSVYSDACDGES